MQWKDCFKRFRLLNQTILWYMGGPELTVVTFEYLPSENIGNKTSSSDFFALTVLRIYRGCGILLRDSVVTMSLRSEKCMRPSRRRWLDGNARTLVSFYSFLESHRVYVILSLAVPRTPFSFTLRVEMGKPWGAGSDFIINCTCFKVRARWRIGSPPRVSYDKSPVSLAKYSSEIFVKAIF